MGRNNFKAITLLVITYTVPFVISNIFQGFDRPCKDTSPQCLKECLQVILPKFINGFPELGIAALDPFMVTNLTFVLPGDIKIDIHQGYTKGLQNCIIDSFRNNGQKYEVQLHCDLTSQSKYRSSGKLLMFPIDGEGDSTIICRNLTIRCTFNVELVTKNDGHKYAQIKNFKANHTFEGKVTYNMTNLFKGNSKMSKLMLDFMNDNGREVADEFGSPIIDFGKKCVLNNIKKLLDSVPVNDLFKNKLI